MAAQNILLKRTNSTDPDFHLLITLLDKELNKRYGELMQSTYDRYNHIIDIDTVLIAYSNGLPAGCGCFKQFDDTSAEIKRMFVKNTERGQGIAYKILSELERWAKESGFKDTILETGDKQHEAIALYQKLGYVITSNYGQYSDLETSICMRKEL
ncbi:GNAT family N-acetyltransferase [Mucilaginibacter sp. BT774]|uniref:GNAT family N-acetyltransferase n=1 Tax=Mucilaginibacter sp. BT774 TaxID=3062276 RepID=UPI002675D680|nr:GNAT family N-acetyltransferase [Mucilaginibacter sp. BT774]MDO3625565.1 GNAT family N-acetyltransferase [Mucilaginibacter sp. BT774]